MLDRRIYTFLDLCETMSYHATARRLNLTQPAVTQHIQALENEYGQKLFLYDHHTLRATPAAEKLAVYSRMMLRNEHSLRAELALPGQRRMRIGATKTIGEYVIAPAAQRYLQNPAHTLTLLVENTASLLRRLENDELDFALIEGAFDRKRYGSRLLRREAFVGICAGDHRFAGRQVQLAELLDETLFVREPGSGTRGITERVLDSLGYTEGQFARTVCMSSFGLICRMVSAGLGVSFTYQAVAETDKTLATFTLADVPLIHEFNYVFLRDTGAEQLIRLFGPI